jgi:hypothetical protein
MNQYLTLAMYGKYDTASPGIDAYSTYIAA